MLRGLKPLALAASLGGAAILAAPAGAQWREGQGPELPAAAAINVLTLDQERLFQESDFGRQTMADYDRQAAALAGENRRKENELEGEERALTQRRGLLAPEEFAKLAQAFDARVVEIRVVQDAKTQELARWLDQRRALFFSQVLPVLTDVLAEKGAVAILQSDAVLIALNAADVTPLAIERANESILVPKDDLPALRFDPVTASRP